MNVAQPTPIRLYLLQFALIEDGIPIPGYLVQTSDGKNILIDTGYPTDDAFLSHPDSQDIVSIVPIVDQLTALGLTPRDIDYLVCTHFDPDHSGGHDAFRWSELIVQRTHYAFARSMEHERLELTRSHWNHPDLRYRLIDGDSELVPGVELIATSGHMPGHQAVLVRLPHTGPVLLAIDAADSATELDLSTRLENNGFDLDPVEARESARKLFELVRHEGVTLTVFGHDAQQWPTLKHAPEFYS